MINLQRLPEALDVLKKGIEVDPQNDVMSELIKETEEEIE